MPCKSDGSTMPAAILERRTSRMLRVPGTVNRKPVYAPDFPEVRLVRVRWDNVCSLLDLERALPKPVVSRSAAILRKYRYRGTGHEPAGAIWQQSGVAEALLDQLNPARADDYADWLSVGMALSELGDAGLTMWDQWSRQKPEVSAGRVC